MRIDGINGGVGYLSLGWHCWLLRQKVLKGAPMLVLADGVSVGLKALLDGSVATIMTDSLGQGENTEALLGWVDDMESLQMQLC